MLVRHRVRRRDVVRGSPASSVSSPVEASSAADTSPGSPASSSPTSPITSSRDASLNTVTSVTRLDSRPSNTRTRCPSHTRHIPAVLSPPTHSSRPGSGKSESAAQRRLPGGQRHTSQPSVNLPAVSPTPAHTCLTRSQPACQPHVASHRASTRFARPSAPRCKGPTASVSAVASLSSPTARDSDVRIDSHQIG